MKIEREDQKFAPITLTIESQAELDYLYALSQSSTVQTTRNANELGFELSKEAKAVQMPFYYKLKEFFV
jgi:hypothetical protein